MAQDLLYVTGDFEGYYYTHQSSPLGAGEMIPGGVTHAVHVYRGQVHEATALQQYNSRDFLDSSGLLLYNVTNIEVFRRDAPADRRIYDFEQVVLKDVSIQRSWEMDGKTYGILKGKFYGKVKSVSATIPPPQPSPNNPHDKPVPPILPGPLPPDKRRGCWDTLWNFLKWLVLLLLLYWLITQIRCCSCNLDKTVIPTADSSCRIAQDSLKRLTDSLQKKITEQERLKNIDLSRLDSLLTQLDERKKRDSAQTGKITLSLMWETTDDLDLALEQPDGRIIYYNDKKDFLHEAELDVDANSDLSLVRIDPIENIYINAPIKGRYKVYVNWYKNRSLLPEVPYFLQIIINNQVFNLEKEVYEPRDVRPFASGNTVYEFDYNN